MMRSRWIIPGGLVLIAIVALVVFVRWDGEVSSTQSLRPLSNSMRADSVEPVNQGAVDTVPSQGSMPATAVAQVDTVTHVTDEVPRALLVSRPIRIQLLNGTTEKGLARRASPKLRSMGFDIREVGNSGEKNVRVCRVIDRSGADSLGLAVADSLGMLRGRVQYEMNAGLVDIDVTLVLGTDYQDYGLASGR
jgi:hypothetical protein